MAECKKEALKEAASKAWGVPAEKIYIRTRKRESCEPRQAITHYRINSQFERQCVIKKETGYTHATIIHSCRVVENLLKTNREFRMKYSRFLQEIEKQSVLL